MGKAKKIIFPIVFLVVSISAVFLCTGGIERIQSFDINEFLGVNSLMGKENIKSNDELINELSASLKKEEKNFPLPDSMSAVWIDINRDLDVEASAGTDAVKYAVYADFDFYRNYVPNTVFIKPDTEGEFSALKESDGSNFDVLAYTLFYVRKQDCKAVLVADDSILFKENGKFSEKELEKYLTNYKFDAVLMSSEICEGNEFVDTVSKLSSFLRKNFPSVAFSAEIKSDFENNISDEYCISIFEQKLVDFGYVDCNTTTNNTDFSFGTVSFWWDSFARYYGVPFYCEHRLDLIFSNDTTWGHATEIEQQLKALYSCPSFDGSCFYGVTSLKTKKQLGRELAIYLNNFSSNAQKNFSVQSLSLNGEKIKFTGKSAFSDANIYINEEPVKSEEGVFSFERTLPPFMNEFYFFSNGADYLYKVYNNIPVVSSYSPSENTDISQTKKLPVKVEALKNSKVFAVINGSTYEIPMSENGTQNSNGNYADFYYEIDFSDTKLLNGELSLYVLYEDKELTVSCGKISTSLFSFENSDSSKTGAENYAKEISPYENQGLGNALMCKLDADNVEIISTKEDYDTYHPDNSSLLNGTYDYVKNINVSQEGYIRYELQSGLNVYATDSILISNGYKMPLNNVVLKNFDDSDLTQSKFTFSLDWLSPVTVKTSPLNFKKGYLEFSYNIDSFNASYIDVTFYYSENISGLENILFSDNCVFSGYEIFDGENDTLILRLHLKNAGKFYGFDLNQNENGDVEITFKKRVTNSVAGKTVMIDPGHGGISMVGTATNDDSVSEASVTLSIANYAKQYLEDMGATVIMTRVRDSSLSLWERTVMCETQNPDIFVSIHCDGSDSLSESGTHTFYYTPYSMPLANSIHNSLVNTYSQKIYTQADSNFERIDRKIKYYPFYVTRVDNCPSVLVETGFMTNNVEGLVLSNPTHQSSLGRAIADGIAGYFSQN